MIDLSSSLVNDAWKEFPDTFGERMNRGWVAYPWIASLLDYVWGRIQQGDARILVSAPPQHGKSEGLSVVLPSCYLSNYPNKSVMLSSYGQSLALESSSKVRSIVRSMGMTTRRDRQKLSRWVIADQVDELQRVRMRGGGGVLAQGVGGQITGFGGDLLICDDPHKNEEDARSDAKLASLRSWWRSTWWTRKRDGTSYIVIHTRWHDDDLIGWLLRERPFDQDWEVIRIPALTTPDDPDPLGIRGMDEVLCPQLQPRKNLPIGSDIWLSMYQQRPVATGGSIWKRDWFQYYHELPAKALTSGLWLHSWDLTFGAGSSWNVGQVWCFYKGDAYLVDQVRFRGDFPTQLDMVRALWQQYRRQTRMILVEEAANGKALVDVLKKELAIIEGVQTGGKSKETRARAVSHKIRDGNVFLPMGRDWVPDYLFEVTRFPYATHDDQVDATSQALHKLALKPGRVRARVVGS